MQIIDPHLHLFARDLGAYTWLKAENPPFWEDKAIINQDFTPQHLELAAPLKLAGWVHIEAGFDNTAPWREIEWLESIPKTTQRTTMKTVACVDLTLPASLFNEMLTRSCNYQSVVGVRHILDEQAAELLSQAQVLKNLATLSARGLIFECQLTGSDSPAISQLQQVLTQLPQLKMALNHAAFPQLATQSYQQWLNNMQLLAKFDQLHVKISGFEMLDRNYQVSYIQQVTDDLIATFGIERLMFASNFPLCLFSNSYQTLWETYCQLALSDTQKKRLMADNAQTFYQF